MYAVFKCFVICFILLIGADCAKGFCTVEMCAVNATSLPPEGTTEMFFGNLSVELFILFFYLRLIDFRIQPNEEK